MKITNLKSLSIRTGLFLAIFAPCILMLLVVGFLVLSYDLYQARDDIERQASVDAELLARSTRAALTLGDYLAAEETLTGLAGNPDIIEAIIYGADGKIFARFAQNPKQMLPHNPTARRGRRMLSVTAPIRVGDQNLGTLYLAVSLQQYNRRVLYFSLGVVAAVLILSVVAALIARSLGGHFSRPIHSLARLAAELRKGRELTLRAPAFSVPEIHQLGTAFNEMVEEIDRQNRDLRARGEELLAANKELTAANRELEAFTSSVSHDLRAPLRAILSYAQLAADPDGDAEGTADFLQRIQKNATKMAGLIDDLLAFSRIDARPLQHDEIDTKAMVEAVWEDLAVQRAGRNIDFKAGDLPHFYGDRALMEQVFINLLSNAVKYTRPRARAEICVSAETRDGKVIYSVADNGVGFDMQYASKLFQMFQRLHSEREFEGTGVGLAIVQRIIARHGGRLWAEAKPGKGATFFFTMQ